jgi:hypothetical protein
MLGNFSRAFTSVTTPCSPAECAVKTFHSCDDYNIDITSPRDDIGFRLMCCLFVSGVLCGVCWKFCGSVNEKLRALEVYLRKGLCSDSVEVDGRILVRINFSYHGAGRRGN